MKTRIRLPNQLRKTKVPRRIKNKLLSQHMMVTALSKAKLRVITKMTHQRTRLRRNKIRARTTAPLRLKTALPKLSPRVKTTTLLHLTAVLLKQKAQPRRSRLMKARNQRKKETKTNLLLMLSLLINTMTMI